MKKGSRMRNRLSTSLPSLTLTAGSDRDDSSANVSEYIDNEEAEAEEDESSSENRIAVAENATTDKCQVVAAISVNIIDDDNDDDDDDDEDEERAGTVGEAATTRVLLDDDNRPTNEFVSTLNDDCKSHQEEEEEEEVNEEEDDDEAKMPNDDDHRSQLNKNARKAEISTTNNNNNNDDDDKSSTSASKTNKIGLKNFVERATKLLEKDAEPDNNRNDDDDDDDDEEKKKGKKNETMKKKKKKKKSDEEDSTQLGASLFSSPRMISRSKDMKLSERVKHIDEANTPSSSSSAASATKAPNYLGTNLLTNEKRNAINSAPSSFRDNTSTNAAAEAEAAAAIKKTKTTTTTTTKNKSTTTTTSREMAGAVASNHSIMTTSTINNKTSLSSFAAPTHRDEETNIRTESLLSVSLNPRRIDDEVGGGEGERGERERLVELDNNASCTTSATSPRKTTNNRITDETGINKRQQIDQLLKDPVRVIKITEIIEINNNNNNNNKETLSEACESTCEKVAGNNNSNCNSTNHKSYAEKKEELNGQQILFSSTSSLPPPISAQSISDKFKTFYAQSSAKSTQPDAGRTMSRPNITNGYGHYSTNSTPKKCCQIPVRHLTVASNNTTTSSTIASSNSYSTVNINTSLNSTHFFSPFISNSNLSSCTPSPRISPMAPISLPKSFDAPQQTSKFTSVPIFIETTRKSPADGAIHLANLINSSSVDVQQTPTHVQGAGVDDGRSKSEFVLEVIEVADESKYEQHKFDSFKSATSESAKLQDPSLKREIMSILSGQKANGTNESGELSLGEKKPKKITIKITGRTRSTSSDAKKLLSEAERGKEKDAVVASIESGEKQQQLVDPTSVFKTAPKDASPAASVQSANAFPAPPFESLVSSIGFSSSLFNDSGFESFSKASVTPKKSTSNNEELRKSVLNRMIRNNELQTGGSKSNQGSPCKPSEPSPTSTSFKLTERASNSANSPSLATSSLWERNVSAESKPNANETARQNGKSAVDAAPTDSENEAKNKFDFNKFKAYLSTFDENNSLRSNSMPPIRNANRDFIDSIRKDEAFLKKTQANYGSPTNKSSYAMSREANRSPTKGGGFDRPPLRGAKPVSGFLDYSSLLHYPMPPTAFPNAAGGAGAGCKAEEKNGSCEKLHQQVLNDFSKQQARSLKSHMRSSDDEYRHRIYPKPSRFDDRAVWKQREDYRAMKLLDAGRVDASKFATDKVKQLSMKPKYSSNAPSFACGLLNKFKFGKVSAAPPHSSSTYEAPNLAEKNPKDEQRLRNYEKIIENSADDVYLPKALMNMSSSSPSLISFMSICSSDTCSESSLSSYLNESTKQDRAMMNSHNNNKMSRMLESLDYDTDSSLIQPTRYESFFGTKNRNLYDIKEQKHDGQVNSAFTRPSNARTKAGLAPGVKAEFDSTRANSLPSHGNPNRTLNSNNISSFYNDYYSSKQREQFGKKHANDDDRQRRERDLMRKLEATISDLDGKNVARYIDEEDFELNEANEQLHGKTTPTSTPKNQPDFSSRLSRESQPRGGFKFSPSENRHGRVYENDFDEDDYYYKAKMVDQSAASKADDDKQTASSKLLNKSRSFQQHGRDKSKERMHHTDDESKTDSLKTPKLPRRVIFADQF